ncbi:cilia- and flagella- associated protein 210-like [Ruditapes philippinarum]|uniref:cilia- and flagella- associated protein 210-like n=1 Tax=Ruditapes philippinarum TaxID=129788 RepID=UPI00295C39F0|nr:cilia- and flagella- associated protein 210-like [Ruditapes philippinarum]
MATVMHGRRRGQMRGTPEAPPQHEGGPQYPDSHDLRQVTILSKSDWDRIQTQLHRKQIEEERLRKIREEREERKNKSKEVVQHWGNTIAGQRQRKLEARKLREAKEEAEKVQIDLEEAKFQAQQRKEAIDKAKTQQYYQTDRVKGFHSALMLTEVLKEREAQLELKRLKEQASHGKDKEWLEIAQREYEEAIRLDQTKAAERIIAAAENQGFLKAQIMDHHKLKDKARMEDNIEGEELQKLAIQNKLEKERLELIRRDEKQQLMDDNRKQIMERTALKKLQENQEDEEDEECRVFAAAKRKMMKLRAEKEKHLHAEKQRQLEAIREKLGAQLKQKLDDEDERIREAVQEAEEKRAKEEAEKEAKMKVAIQSQAEHRHLQMKEAEQKKKEERRQELETIRIRQAADEIFRRNEEEKRTRKFDENRGVARFHLDQQDMRKNKEFEEKQQNLALDKANVELLAVEESQFQEYASKVIDHCEKGGRNTYPLRKAARGGHGGGAGPVFDGKGGIRPSYMVMDKSGKQMPHYQRDSTEETKQNQNDVKTKKRLGFVW